MRRDAKEESTRQPASAGGNVSWAGAGFVLFHVGFFTLVTQAVLIREFLVLYLGSEIALGVFYSAWLVWIGIGAALFLPFARRGRGAGADWLAAGLAVLPVAALLELAALRWMRAWLGVPAAEIVPLGQMALSTFAATALVGLPAGFVFAVACRTATVASERPPAGGKRATRTASSSAPAFSSSSDAENANGEDLAPRETASANRVGLLFGFEALGGFLGGVVHTFGFAGRFSTDQVAWLLTGLVGLHLAAWMGLLLRGQLQGLRAGSLTKTEGGREPAIALRRNGRPAVWLALGALLLLGGLFYLATPMGRVRLKEAQSERFARARPGFEWVAAAESRYQRLELARRGGRYTPSANEKIGGQYTLFANGKVAFSFPNRIDNRRQVALAMAQSVRGAERVLVLGAAEGELLAELLEYPSLKHVDAVALDPRTADLVSPYLDARAKAALGDPRVRVHFTDPRAFVNRTSHDEPYDLVLVNAPDPTSASVNRLFTREFFERTRRAMNPDGVLITGMVSAANYQGKEVRDFAGSVVATVRSVFPKVALAPGDWMTVIASVAPDVATVDAEELSRRFRRVRPPSGEFNPEAFATLLPEGEVRAVAERFADVQGPINRDAQPMTYYLATILWSRFSGSTWTRDALEAVEKQGLALALIPFLSFWLARLLYVGLSRDGGRRVRADRFNAWLTVAGLGATGMAASLMLVLAYQSSVGLLYGRIGLLAALFMAGIGAGSLLTGRLREGTASARFLLMSSLGAMSVLFLLFRRPLLGDAAWAGAAVMMSLVIAGALLGVAFAAAARILRDSGGRTGAWLDAADHAGGALGAIATGSVAIPLLGFGPTALLGATVTAGLFALNAQAFWLERRRGARREIAEPEPSAIKDRFRPVGWMLAALLVSAYALGARIHYRPAEAKPSFRISPNELAQWLGTAAWEERAQPFAHWRAADAAGREAPRVAFATDQTAPDVRGYAGPITLAVDMDGKELRGVRLLDCRETPSYVLGLEAWLKGFAGKPLGRGWELGRDIDGVTGATVTCQAVVETLNRSVYRGGVDLLDLDLDPGAYRQESWQRNLLAPAPVTVALCFILLVPCYRWGGDRARLLFLILMVCMLGVYLNRAVTLLEVGNVSLGRWPSPSNAAGAVMLGGVAVLTLLWGSVFCGYLCPFGALQEIAARLSDPRGEKRFRLSGGLKALRSLRYVLAALSLAGFWLACDAAGAWGGRQWLAWSPLQTFFAASKSKLLWLGGGAALLATFAVPRFWCLYLCPTGAVLSAWNRFALLRRTRLFRAPDYGACDLGAAAAQPRDCLRCNRCRVLPHPRAELAPSRRRTIPGVLAAVLVCLLVSYSARVDVLEREGGTASAVASEGASRARDLDVRAIDDALRTGRLSDREASFYESLTPTPTPSRDGN